VRVSIFRDTRRRELASQTQIGQLADAVRVQKYVLRLEVAVDYVQFM
jgi:hypothetical protein